MNKYIQLSLFALIFSLTAGCQSGKEVQPASQQTDTLAKKDSALSENVASPSPAEESVALSSNHKAQSYATAHKGKIETVREIPVYSRIAEQIVMFGIEKTGQHVKKGQVVARLSDAALREKILHCRAKLEKADFQYQTILIGQGYKRNRLDAVPDDIKQLARINSGYNEAKAELHALELQLTYCTITAPVSGAVSQIRNTLYGAARPGEALFYIVDTEHLKMSFDVLENELSKYQMGTSVTVSTVAYPTEQHTATISAISPVIDNNGMVHIEATLTPHPHLKPGMTAFVTLNIEH